MILTDSEVGLLKVALRCWERVGYVSTATVFVGCLGEFVAEFTSLLKTKETKHRLARLSLIVLILGIAGELLSAVRTSQLSGQVIASIEERSRDAEQKAAEAELAALKLQQQLIAQGSRAALLYGANRDRLIERLKPFAPQKIEIRYCRTSFNQFFIDNDTMGVTMLLETILSKGGHWEVSPPVTDNCSGAGIEVSVSPKASDSVRKAAGALWVALHDIPLTMLGDKPFVMESPRPERPKIYDCGTTSKCENKEIILPPLPSDTIVLTVLSHP